MMTEQSPNLDALKQVSDHLVGAASHLLDAVVLAANADFPQLSKYVGDLTEQIALVGQITDAVINTNGGVVDHSNDLFLNDKVEEAEVALNAALSRTS